MRRATGPERLIPDPDAPASPVTVLCVDGDESGLADIEAALGDGGFAPVTGTSTAALRHVGEVDCVVSGDELGDVTATEFLDDLRERDPEVPFLLHANDPAPALTEAVLDDERTDFLSRDAPAADALLRRRIRGLVEPRRATRALQRLLVGVQAARDGIAVAGPDGDFRFVNRVYATRLGYDPDELVGRPWRDAYADEAVEHIESAALPSIESGWRWTGRCAERRKGGETTPARTCIVGLDDGSLVFTAYGADDGGE